MFRKYGFPSLLLSFFLFLNAGCAILWKAETGPKFNVSDLKQLKLGATKIDEFRRVFNKAPLMRLTSETENGEAQRLIYSRGAVLRGHLYTRLVNSEFRKGVLNGYLILSNYPDEKMDVDFGRRHEIKKGTTTEKEVIKLLGEPMGKAKVPTTLEIPELPVDSDNNPMGVLDTVYYYGTSTDKFSVFSGTDGQGETLLIGFNRDHKVIAKKYSTTVVVT